MPPGDPTTRNGAYYGAPEDLSIWIASPGQALWIHLDSATASQARERADAGYFAMPLDGGFFVRNLCTLKTSVTLHVSVVSGPLVRLPQLVLRDALLRTHGRLAGQAGIIQEATQPLYAKLPLTTLADPRLVLLDPLTRLPGALVPAVAEDGSFLLVDEHTWSLGPGVAGSGLASGAGGAASGGHARAGIPRHVRFGVSASGASGSTSSSAPGTGALEAPGGAGDGSAAWASVHAASEPARKKGSAAYFRSLPLPPA